MPAHQTDVMLIRRIATVARALVPGLGALSVAPAAAATKPLPVPYTFLSSAVIAGLGVNADPPGWQQLGV